MKVSLAWVRMLGERYHTSTEPAPNGISELVEKIGAQLGAVEEVIDLGERYKGIAVAKVIACERHPNADKLSVCLLDDKRKIKNVKRDSRGLVQVVCGAPNVTAGQLVAWIPPGATVPATFDKDPFILEAKELRGVISNGMIASAAELDMGDDHTGILVLEQGKPGEPLAKILKLDDYIIDIENKMFTHRPDCFGILGVAREIAGISGKRFKSPAWYKEKPALPVAKSRLSVAVKNDLPKQVPRFCALAIEGVSVGPSPAWLRSYLARVGIKPINVIVDITNFFMYETGQPLHAYDLDKLATGKLGVRPSQKGEKLKIIGGKEVMLKSGAIVITDGLKPVGLGGVMGGADTQVDESTKNIVLEAATFDMNLTRKTAIEYGLFTDAATRFTKNQSPRQNLAVVLKAADDVARLAGGKPGKLTDVNNVKPENRSVHLPGELVNERLGLNLTSAQMKQLLENVEFSVQRERGKLAVTPPFWRTDIEIPEDVIEEIGRLYGWDHLPLVLPKRDLTAARQDETLQIKSRIRNILSAAGTNEVLTYSFVHGTLLDKVGQDKTKAYQIANALSPSLQYYRLTLLPSLLEKIHPNIKAGAGEFVMFELGKTHVKGMLDNEKLPVEFDSLALALTTGAKEAPYYFAAYYASYLLGRLGIQAEYTPVHKAKAKPEARHIIGYFEPSRSALLSAGGKWLGIVGEPTAQVAAQLKLPAGTAMFELEVSRLLELAANPGYEPLNRFPETSQDICLKLSGDLAFAGVDEFIWQQLEKLSAPHGYDFRVGVIDVFQRPNDKTHKQITWRISLWHPERTLTTAEANKLMDNLAVVAKTKFKAERI